MKKIFLLLSVSFLVFPLFLSAQTVQKKVEGKVTQQEKKASFLKATKAALKSIPKIAQQPLTISWYEWTPVYRQIGGTRVQEGNGLSYHYSCNVLFLDYNEKDSLGNVTVAIPWDCFNNFKESERQGNESFSFEIDLGAFSDSYNYAKEYNQDFEYIPFYGCELSNLALCGFRARNVITSGYKVWFYTLQMPVRNPEIQKWMRSLIQKNPITLEKAALATRALWKTATKPVASISK